MIQLAFGRSVLLTVLRQHPFPGVDSLIGLNMAVMEAGECECAKQSAPLTELVFQRFDFFQGPGIRGQRETIDGVICTQWLGRMTAEYVSERLSGRKKKLETNANRPEGER